MPWDIERMTFGEVARYRSRLADHQAAVAEQAERLRQQTEGR